MREFFKNIIANLYVYCGNRQAEKMSIDELKMLLDALERVSQVYSYIPQDEQKRIIEKCLIEDKEYQNINARVISKWLEINGKKFFQEAAHKENPQPQDYKVATGEDRDRYIQEFLNAIAQANTNFSESMQKGSGSRLKDALESNNIIIPDEVKEAKEIERQYRIENYDDNGNCAEHWKPKDEWLKKREKNPATG